MADRRWKITICARCDKPIFGTLATECVCGPDDIKGLPNDGCVEIDVVPADEVVPAEAS